MTYWEARRPRGSVGATRREPPDEVHASAACGHIEESSQNREGRFPAWKNHLWLGARRPIGLLRWPARIRSGG
jgi:hypothetical protein